MKSPSSPRSGKANTYHGGTEARSKPTRAQTPQPRAAVHPSRPKIGSAGGPGCPLSVKFFPLRDDWGRAYKMTRGSREAAAEPILHPRVESSRGFQRVKGRGFQDGIFFGERACTDTLGLQ